MSALGFGLFVGTSATAAGVIPRAVRNPGALSGLIFLGGIVAWVAVPSLIPGLGGFLIGALLPIGLAYPLLRSRIAALTEERLLDEERRASEAQAYQDRRAAAKEQAGRWPADQVGSTHISAGRLMHVKGQPKCFFMLANNGAAVRIVEYEDAPDFEIHSDMTLPLSRVISLNVASPTITKTRTKTIPVTVVEKKE